MIFPAAMFLESDEQLRVFYWREDTSIISRIRSIALTSVSMWRLCGKMASGA